MHRSDEQKAKIRRYELLELEHDAMHRLQEDEIGVRERQLQERAQLDSELCSGLETSLVESERRQSLAEDLSRQLSESLQQKEHELVAAEAQLLKLSDQLSQCELHHMGLQRQLGEMTAEGTSHMQEITTQRELLQAAEQQLSGKEQEMAEMRLVALQTEVRLKELEQELLDSREVCTALQCNARPTVMPRGMRHPTPAPTRTHGRLWRSRRTSRVGWRKGCTIPSRRNRRYVHSP
jgi:hypothetical protein